MRLRSFVTTFAFAAAALAFSAPARAQAPADYPNRVVRFVVPFTPGASTDLISRVFGQKLSEKWGHQVIVENRGGAGGGLGADMVAKSEPDGYTILIANQGPAIFNVLLRKASPYKLEDFAPIVRIGYSPLIIVANPKFPPNNMKELVEYAKANPGKVHLGSSGTNSNLHVAIEMLNQAAGTSMVHVPYRGTGPALNDVISGSIQGAYTTTVSAEGLIKSGQVKVLGVTGDTRVSVIPNVGTFSEAGIKGADANLWIGAMAPAKTPRAIVELINRDFNAVLQMPDVKARFAQWGMETGGGTPEVFAEVIKSEVERVNALISAKALEVQ